MNGDKRDTASVTEFTYANYETNIIIYACIILQYIHMYVFNRDRLFCLFLILGLRYIYIILVRRVIRG